LYSKALSWSARASSTTSRSSAPGPVGLYAAYYSGLRECRTKLIETYPQVGGRLISMYPEKEIFDVAGHRKIVAAGLIRELTDQAMQYDPTVVLNERVTGLRILDERVIELTTPKGAHYTQTAILAAGCGAIVPRKLDIRTSSTSRGTDLLLPALLRAAARKTGADRGRREQRGGLGPLPGGDRHRGDPLPPDVQVACPRGDGAPPSGLQRGG